MKSFRTLHWVTFFWFLCPAVAIASSVGMSGTEAASAQATVTVGVDPRVELVAELCRLAGYNEYAHSLMPNYAKSVDAYFNRYATLPAVQKFKQLRNTAGLGYDSPMGLALLLPASPAGKPHVSAKELHEDQITLDIKDAQAFLNAAQRFRRDTGADKFFAAQRPLYAQIEQDYKKQISNRIDVGWFERMFGSSLSRGRFVVIPALLNGPSMYGKHIRIQDGTITIYAILGVARNERLGGYWHERSLGLLVHELLHSYMNPWVDAHATRLQPLMQPLYTTFTDQMNDDAYAGWRVVTYETMVRAGVLTYFSDHHNAEGRASALRQDQEQGFVWIERVASALAHRPAELQPWIKANETALFKVLAALGRNPPTAATEAETRT